MAQLAFRDSTPRTNIPRIAGMLASTVPSIISLGSNLSSQDTTLFKGNLNTLIPQLAEDTSVSSGLPGDGVSEGEKILRALQQDYPKHKRLLARLARSDSIGIEVLREAYMDDDHGLEKALDLLASKKGVSITLHQFLSQRGWVGWPALREGFKKDSESLVRSLLPIPGGLFKELFPKNSKAMEYYREAVRENGDTLKGLTRILQQLQAKDKAGLERFFNIYDRIERTEWGGSRLLRTFIDPNLRLPLIELYKAMFWLGAQEKKFFRHVHKVRGFDVNGMLETNLMDLVFVFDKADHRTLEATKGLIRLLGIERRHVQIGFTNPETEKFVKTHFKNFRVTNDVGPGAERLLVHFGEERLYPNPEGRLYLDRELYQYFYQPRVSKAAVTAVRTELNVGQNRQIYHYSPAPGRRLEFKTFLRAFLSLPRGDPLEKSVVVMNLKNRQKGFMDFLEVARKDGAIIWDRVADSANPPKEPPDIILLKPEEDELYLAASDYAVIGYQENPYRAIRREKPLIYIGEKWKRHAYAIHHLEHKFEAALQMGAVPWRPSSDFEAKLAFIRWIAIELRQGGRQAKRHLRHETAPNAELYTILRIAQAVITKVNTAVVFQSLLATEAPPPEVRLDWGAEITADFDLMAEARKVLRSLNVYTGKGRRLAASVMRRLDAHDWEEKDRELEVARDILEVLKGYEPLEGHPPLEQETYRFEMGSGEIKLTLRPVGDGVIEAIQREVDSSFSDLINHPWPDAATHLDGYPLHKQAPVSLAEFLNGVFDPDDADLLEPHRFLADAPALTWLEDQGILDGVDNFIEVHSGGRLGLADFLEISLLTRGREEQAQVQAGDFVVDVIDVEPMIREDGTLDLSLLDARLAGGLGSYHEILVSESLPIRLDELKKIANSVQLTLLDIHRGLGLAFRKAGTMAQHLINLRGIDWSLRWAA